MAAKSTRSRITEKPRIVLISGSDIPVLMPFGYRRIRHLGISNEDLNGSRPAEATFIKDIGSTKGTVLFTTAPVEEALPANDLTDLINYCRRGMKKNQGILECSIGRSIDDIPYAYAIIKGNATFSDFEEHYFLRLNLFSEASILEITARYIAEEAFFGIRDSVSEKYAKAAGIIQSDKRKEWSRDPYDPKVDYGSLKRISDREGLDSLFPDSAMSQMRELIHAALDHDLVQYREDNPDMPVDEDYKEIEHKFDNLPPEEKEKATGEYCKSFFVDEYRRTTYKPDIDWEQVKADALANWEACQDRTAEPPADVLIPAGNAIHILYYVMVAGNQFNRSEKEDFEAMARCLDPEFDSREEDILRYCQLHLAGITNVRDLFTSLRDAVAEELFVPVKPGEAYLTAEALLVDLLIAVYRLWNCSEQQRRLLLYIARQLGFSENDYQLKESIIVTYLDLFYEKNWLERENGDDLKPDTFLQEVNERMEVLGSYYYDMLPVEEVPNLFLDPATAEQMRISREAEAAAAEEERKKSAPEQLKNNIEQVTDRRLLCGMFLEDLGREKLSILGNSMAVFLDLYTKITNIDFQCNDDMAGCEEIAVTAEDLKKLKAMLDFVSAMGDELPDETWISLGACDMVSWMASGDQKASLPDFPLYSVQSPGEHGFAAKEEDTALDGLISGPVWKVLGLAGGGEDKPALRVDEAEQMNVSLKEITVCFENISNMTKRFYNILAHLDADFLPYVYSLKEIIEKSGTDFSTYSDDDKESVIFAAAMAGAIQSVFATTLLAEDGSLDEGAEEACSVFESILWDVNFNDTSWMKEWYRTDIEDDDDDD